MAEDLIDLPLFQSTLTSIAQSASSCYGLLSSLKVDTELSYPNGISLLSLKNSLLLSYMHRLTLLTMAKLQGRSLQSDERVRKLLVEELVRERVMLEKIRPLEAKLRYQVDKLVTKADNADKQDAERAAGMTMNDDDIANDPLAFKPNPAAMIGSDGSDDGDDTSTDKRKSQSDGIYRPPRLAPVVYNEEQRGKKARKPAPNTLVRDFAASLGSNPYMESTSGLSVTPALQSRKANKLAEIQRYEEDNMTRLFMTKKDAKRRRLDEQEVALGGSGTREDLMAGSKGVRGRAAPGFEMEFDDLLGNIAKKRKTGQADGFDALRSMRRERKAPAADPNRELMHTNGVTSLDTGKKSKKSQFATAMKRNRGRQSGKTGDSRRQT